MSNCTCPARPDGLPYNEFIATHFHECLYTTREIASFIVGMSSLAFWIACQMPQFVKNYQRKSGGALSKWFLLEWFLGDALNLVGALLTQQLATQIATGILFIINDLLMISQITYYTFYGVKEVDDDSAAARQGQYEPLLEEDESEESGNEGENGSTRGGPSFTSLATVVVPVVTMVLLNNNKFGANTTLSSPMMLLNDAHDELPDCEPQNHVSKEMQDIGMAIGWISSIVYLNSRIPQILKNQRRKSVQGLSIIMFACAVMGNTTYGLGVLLRDSSWKAIKKALPWLVGSLGTLSLDFTILMQFWCFDEDSQEESQVIEPIRTPGGTRVPDRFRIVARQHQSPRTSGLYGMKAWNTSPFFRPMSGGMNRGMPPLNLRDTASLGILPSETSQSLEGSLAQHMQRPSSSSDHQLRSRSGSH